VPESKTESRSSSCLCLQVEPGDTSSDITNPVLAPSSQHWDNVLADTVSVVGCQCTFCSLRSAHEVTERGRRKRQARVVLPPRSSVLDILYRFPSNEFQGGNSMLSSSSNACNMTETRRSPSHYRIVGIPEFEQFAPSSQDALKPPGTPIGSLLLLRILHMKRASQTARLLHETLTIFWGHIPTPLIPFIERLYPRLTVLFVKHINMCKSYFLFCFLKCSMKQNCTDNMIGLRCT
jgi:hypothetical protein